MANKENDQADIDIINQLDNDVWLSRILRRTQLTPLRTFLVVLAFNLISAILLATLFGALSSRHSSRGFSRDWPTWAFEFVLQPAILGCFCWLQNAGKILFRSLMDEGFLSKELSEEELIRCRQRMRDSRISRIATLLGLLGGGLALLAFTGTLIPTTTSAWLTSHPALAWARAPTYSVITYAIILSLYDIMVVVTTLNNLLRRQGVHIEPFHPDDAGGLGAIGRFSADLGYIVGAIGLTLSVSIVYDLASFVTLRDYVLFSYTVAYLVLAPLIFFAPPWVTHLAMLQYREKLLIGISAELDKVLGQLEVSRSNHPEEIEPILKRIQQLSETRTITKQFTVWPFNTTSIQRFFGLFLSPLIPTVISILALLVS